MSRLLMIGAAALAATALPLGTASAQSGEYYSAYDGDSTITVQGPRQRVVGRGSSGAPIYEQEAAVTVNYGDLDLRTSSGRDALYMRVDAAASDACNALDGAYGAADDFVSPGECRADAKRRAQGSVRDAIERASYSSYYSGY